MTIKEAHKLLDELNIGYFNSLALAFGSECVKCKWIQGTPKKGLNYYFCNHLTDALELEQTDRKQEAMRLLCQDLGGENEI